MSIKNGSGEHGPEINQTRKFKQWHFELNGQIRAGAGSVLVRTVIGTAASVNEVTEGNSMLLGGKAQVFADTGNQGSNKNAETKGVAWECEDKCARNTGNCNPVVRKSCQLEPLCQLPLRRGLCRRSFSKCHSAQRVLTRDDLWDQALPFRIRARGILFLTASVSRAKASTQHQRQAGVQVLGRQAFEA